MSFIKFLILFSWLKISLAAGKPSHQTFDAEEDFIKVMVVDTGVHPHPLLLDYLDMSVGPDDLKDVHGHGTAMASVIAYGDISTDDRPACKKVKIISCKYFFESGSMENIVECFNKAAKLRVNYVLFSSSGQDPDKDEYNVLKRLEYLKIPVFVATGNNRVDLSEFPRYPSYYGLSGLLKNIVSVINILPSGAIHSTSNYHPAAVRDYGTNVKVLTPRGDSEYMTGTSVSAARYLYRVLQVKCKSADSVRGSFADQAGGK